MARISARNNELLKSSKKRTSPKIYAILSDLVNEGREDLAEKVLEADSLLEYTSTCIRLRDLKEAAEVLQKVRARIDMLKNEGANIDYLEYLYEGIAKKAKSF